jgi:hypothetical protein
MVAEPINVGGSPNGPLSLCVIDATGDIEKWEYATTKFIVEQCRQAKIPTEAHFVESLEELTANVDPQATAILIVCHGGKDPKDPNVAKHFWTGRTKQFWAYLTASGLDLSERLVVLCICSAFNHDMIDAMANSQVDASIVVAPETPISQNEAEAFFPEFFKRLKPRSVWEIQPEAIKLLVDELNSLSGNRMRVVFAGQNVNFSVADNMK